MLTNKLGVINIRKRTLQEWMLLGLFLLPLTLAFLTEFLGLPPVVRFLMDALVVGLCGMLLVKRYIVFSPKAKPMISLIAIFFIYAVVVYFLNYQSVFYFLWGARNTFRFYLAFLAFVAYFSEEEAYSCFKILDFLFWVNFVLAFYQFIVLRVHQDMLGGIFGVNDSANGYTLIFFCIVIGRSLIRAFEGSEKYLYCIIKCFASLVVAAIAEMKFYYIAFVLMLFIASVFTRFTKGKVIVLVTAVLGVIVGASLLTFLFDEFADFLSLENLWELATKENYSSEKDLNRLSAIFTLMSGYVTDIGDQIFGLGLGNCDTSNFAIFNSTFYQNYSYLHYTWFPSAMLFLETGLVGLGMYLSFFVLCIVHSYKQIKNKVGNRLFCQLAILMASLCIVITFYGPALRIEAGYMAYCVLALPFLASGSSETEKGVNESVKTAPSTRTVL